MKCHFIDNFSKTVNLIFNGLTGVDSLCSILRQEITKKDRFSYRYKLIVCSLRLIDKYQNLYSITVQMRETFDLCFNSIASIVFKLFCSYKLKKLHFLSNSKTTLTRFGSRGFGRPTFR